MALSISKAVEQIKSDLFSILPADIIITLCRQLNYHWRDRCLNPVTTIQAFLLQILHGNVACDHVSHLMGRRFTGEAYCQARSRLPLELFRQPAEFETALIQSAACGDSRGHCILWESSIRTFVRILQLFARTRWDSASDARKRVRLPVVARCSAPDLRAEASTEGGAVERSC